MKNYIKHHPWSIIEEGFHKEYSQVSESIFSIGNGRFGQRANFEEGYSGETLLGNYVAGVYYPDKTRVGWWKNGYPEYFAKVLNAVNWIGIAISIDGEKLDLNNCEIHAFHRELKMNRGLLERSFEATTPGGKRIKVAATRFCSIVNDELGAIEYRITPLNFEGKVEIGLSMDFDVVNQDSNYDEKFWIDGEKELTENKGFITATTKKSNFTVGAGMVYEISNPTNSSQEIIREKYIESRVEVDTVKNEEIVVHKYVSILSSENHESSAMHGIATSNLEEASSKGFQQLKEEQSKAWEHKWEIGDIIIDGDVAAQQGIRFNIFQLNQTYTGEDPRLNIGPKGFTGEKYGGSTYWDTEAYCLAFYLSTADEKVARNLLMYRYKHLQKAIENAENLGFTDGAALYPMVTMNGEECHNEWEITFEEIHRNGAIAYAIFEYIQYTGDDSYLEFGLEVLIGISRFWAQRVNFSAAKGKYVMLGVTGPNEYENNVNNNWYTNQMAIWTLKYTIESLNAFQEKHPEKHTDILAKTKFSDSETTKWQEIIDNMYFPYDEERDVFLQQDNFLDKELIPVSELDPKHRPLNQNWSWDRILRSCYIKQADVLQGIYVFQDQFDQDTIRRNYEFYEPITVHESSLSPCVHSILAARLGMHDKAYEMYLRTSRLDLDDYNNDTEDGCHTTSMAGSWLSLVRGFGGMKVEDGHLSFNPFVPNEWDGYTFRIRFRDQVFSMKAGKSEVEIINHSDQPVTVTLFDDLLVVASHDSACVPTSLAV